MIVALALACTSDGGDTRAADTGPVDTGSVDTSAPPDLRCDGDGDLLVELPAEGGLAALDHAGDLAGELLGATPTWRGDLRGLEIDDRGVPMGDGEIPSWSPSEGMTMVRVGWQTTWCAGDREVVLTASATEATATCRAAAAPCAEGAAERPSLDAADAIAAVGATSWSWHAVLFQTGEAPPTLAWQVLWYEDTIQPFAFVDARTGEILPCADDAPPACRDR